MNKTFTLSEAQTLLPVLDALLQRAQAATLRAGTLEYEMQQLSERIYISGGLHVDIVGAARRRAERDKATQEARDTVAEIEEIGVRIHDIAEGLLDFPCLLDGNVVLLCWKSSEAAITHWHEEEDEPTSRHSLGTRFISGDRDRPN